MATNVTKTSHFTSGAGNPISFSQIRTQFGGQSTNIKASEYLRNEGEDVDWDGPNASTIIPRIPDAKENEDIATGNNWNVDSLRDSITEYNVTQSGNNEELSYIDSDVTVWNGNLNRNILKKFDVTGTIYANETDKDALTFSGDLYNLEIEVDEAGAIYGEGGTIGGETVNETVNITDVQGTISIGSFGSGSIIVTRYNDGVTGTEGHALGSIGYYIYVDNISSVNLGVSSVNPTTRASGATVSDNSIALSTGYPQTLTSTKFKVAFDMTNSQGSGKQATYARSFSITVTGTSNLAGSGGDALYVNNTYTKSDVEIRSYGKIFAGGGGGAQGTAGNSGGNINNCTIVQRTWINNPYKGGVNLGHARPGQSCRGALSGSVMVPNAHQSAIRSRCRGSGARKGNGIYPYGSYQCSEHWTFECKSTNYYSVGGGAGGGGGNGGVGQGYSNQSGPGSGNSGDSGRRNACRGASSTGSSGNPGTPGGTWGANVVGGGSGGKAVQKKNAKVTHYSSNTIKGAITNI